MDRGEISEARSVGPQTRGHVLPAGGHEESRLLDLEWDFYSRRRLLLMHINDQSASSSYQCSRCYQSGGYTPGSRNGKSHGGRRVTSVKSMVRSLREPPPCGPILVGRLFFITTPLQPLGLVILPDFWFSVTSTVVGYHTSLS